MHAARRLLALALDSGPVVVLAAIAAVGSFTHVSHLAGRKGQHGWMSWAIAVCIDLTCVMAARERQRDKRTNRPRHGLISWPTLVLIGGITLTLAANLAEAQPTIWGYIVAGTPAAAFLVAVSMLERRATHTEHAPDQSAAAPAPLEAESTVTVERDTTPAPRPAVTAPAPTPAPAPAPAPAPPASVAGPSPTLLDFARQVSAQHQDRHGHPITADQLRSRLRVPAELATTLHEQITAPG